MPYPFRQVDVFGRASCSGNPVAVVLEAEGLSEEAMRRFAVWTNPSETTFVLPPTLPEADYAVRIFARENELPFAGHPTLGTARAWLDAGGQPHRDGRIVQECGAGLVDLRHDGENLAFAAPERLRSGPVEPETVAPLVDILGVRPEQVLDTEWLDNGPGWVGVLLDSAQTVLEVQADFMRRPGTWKIGLIGAYPEGSEADFELRALVRHEGRAPFEDPVTGSLNAAAAQWLIGTERAPTEYAARQGTAIGRNGRISIVQEDDEIWVGGATTVVLGGEADL